MKTQLGIKLTVSVLILAGIFGTACRTGGSLTGKTDLRSQIHDSIEFQIAVPEVSRMEEGVKVTFTIRNNKKHPIVYPVEHLGWPYFRLSLYEKSSSGSDSDDRVWMYFRMSVSEPRENRVPLTHEWTRRYVRQWTLENYPTISRIDPGRERVWDVDLLEIFQLSSGKYTLDVELMAYDTGRNPRYEVIDYDEAGRPLPVSERTSLDVVVRSRFEYIPIKIE